MLTSFQKKIHFTSSTTSCHVFTFAQCEAIAPLSGLMILFQIVGVSYAIWMFSATSSPFFAYVCTIFRRVYVEIPQGEMLSSSLSLLFLSN